jgi:hypothetical protein
MGNCGGDFISKSSGSQIVIAATISAVLSTISTSLQSNRSNNFNYFFYVYNYLCLQFYSHRIRHHLYTSLGSQVTSLH